MTERLSHFDRPELFIACALAAILGYSASGSVFYNGWEDFLDCLRLFFQPSWLSFLRDEWADHNWELLKLILFVVVCAALVAAAYKAEVFLTIRIATETAL